jgi:hypothetical protein
MREIYKLSVLYYIFKERVGVSSWNRPLAIFLPELQYIPPTFPLVAVLQRFIFVFAGSRVVLMAISRLIPFRIWRFKKGATRVRTWVSGKSR